MEGQIGKRELIWAVMLPLLGWVLCKALRSWRVKDRGSRNGGGGRIPRGSSGWPLIGETLDFIAAGYSSCPVTFMEKRKSLYGKVFRTHILGRPVIVSTDAEVNKAVLHNHGNVFVPCYPKSINELLGESSILQMSGSLHKRVHALIGGFLRSPQVKVRVTKDIESSVKQSLARWMQDGDSHRIYFQHEAKTITFEILVKVLMSIGPGDNMKFLKREFEEFIKGLICLPVKFPGTRLYKSLQAKERLLKMVRKIVEERKMAMERNGDEGLPRDAIDILLHDAGELKQSSRLLPSDSVGGNVVEMMIPGEDSVPMVITLAVKYLGDNPVALASLVKENMELKRQKAQSGDEYCWTDYIGLPFTQDVISETLRMANIINAVWRKSLKDVEIKGYLIPKGWCVMASFSSVHMDEVNYEDPYRFDPWRWQKTGGGGNSNNFTPFGGGQRLCPGLELSRLEISIFLHHFVTTYRWVAEEDSIVYFPTVKMRRKFPITIMAIEG